MRSRTMVAALAGLTILSAGTAAATMPLADGPHEETARKAKKEDEVLDHEFARQAVQRREVLPMPRVLGLIGTYQAGEVVEVELKARGKFLYYDVDVLAPSGQVHSLLIDARTGKLLANKAKG